MNDEAKVTLLHHTPLSSLLLQWWKRRTRASFLYLLPPYYSPSFKLSNGVCLETVGQVMPSSRPPSTSAEAYATPTALRTFQLSPLLPKRSLSAPARSLGGHEEHPGMKLTEYTVVRNFHVINRNVIGTIVLRH